MSCEYCEMAVHMSGTTAWWQGADYEDDARIASVQASDAVCEHFELWIEEYDKWNDEMHVVDIPIAYCPWCGSELIGGGDD